MKKYQIPEIEVTVLFNEDVLTSSKLTYSDEGAGDSINWGDGVFS